MTIPLHQVLQGDAAEVLATLPADSVHCVVTSPPYWQLRDYGVEGQLGLEATPEEFVEKLVAIMREVRRVLRPDGIMWLNLGDSYAGGGCGARDPERWPKQSRNDHMPVHAKKRCGLAEKQLVGVPWRVALALQADGWWLRSEVIWHKPNAMPGALRDRPETSHEHVFLLTKRARYFYDSDAIRTPLAAKTMTALGTTRAYDAGDALGKVRSANLSRDVPVRSTNVDENGEPVGANVRTVWTIATVPSPSKHYAMFPPELARRCILAGTSAAGACPLCGAPWVRDVERVRLLDGEPVTDAPAMRTTSKRAPSSAQGIAHRRFSTRHVTTGWSPSCSCDAGDPVPCIVLDPFAGSGTTGVVAYGLGRDFIGVDIAGGLADLGGHTANDRISAARRGQSLEEYLAGQRTIFDVVGAS